jgi:hypothetical protein
MKSLREFLTIGVEMPMWWMILVLTIFTLNIIDAIIREGTSAIGFAIGTGAIVVYYVARYVTARIIRHRADRNV